MLAETLVQRIHTIDIPGEGPKRGVTPFVRAYEYEPSGPPAKGTPTLVLAHGWTLNHESWERVVRRLLLSHDVRVIAYDQPGHGTSSKVAGKASVRDLGEVMRLVLDQLCPNDPVVLAGHSMGGMTIMAYAGLYPERFRATTEGVALLSTAPTVDARHGLPGERTLMRLFAAAPAGLRTIPLPRVGLAQALFGDDPDASAVKATAAIMNSSPAKTVGAYFQALMEHDETEALEQFGEVPTTILVGTKDNLTPARWAREYHERINGSKLVQLPGKAHMLTYEATGEVTAALEELLFGEDERRA